MFCSRCGRPVEPGAQFCPACGQAVAPPPSAPLLPETIPASPALLTTLPQLVMVYEGGLGRVNFGFEDPAGRFLGATQGEIAFPLKYTLFDENQRPVLILDGARAHGLLYDFLVHDPSGAILATIRQQSSFMSRKYGISVDGAERMLLTADAMGYHYQIVENGSGAILATGERTSGFRRSTVSIAFPPDRAWDHRIGIGAMILIYYLCTRK